MKSCDNCKYSGVQVGSDKTINKICRRHPPRIQLVPMPTRDGMQVQGVTTWPGINDTDWCGWYEGKLSS